MTIKRMSSGLKKICPRCGKEGDVVVLIHEDNPQEDGLGEVDFEIAWKGGSVDTCLGIGDLFDPKFGCGFDR